MTKDKTQTTERFGGVTLSDILAPSKERIATLEQNITKLLEAAKAVVAEFIEMSGRIEETPLNIQRLQQVICKTQQASNGSNSG